MKRTDGYITDQTPLAERFFAYAPGDAEWTFDDNPPKINFKRTWHGYSKVDPTPAYGPDPVIVSQLAYQVETLLPVAFPPSWHLLPFEAVGRTNGFAQWQEDYRARDDRDGKRYETYIGLSGKRIPIMPSMLRYLVAHEYGHVVWYHVCGRQGHHYYSDEGDQLEAEYARLRGIEHVKEYGPGRWHQNTGEIIANDIRILLFGAEPEFWPHECAHPKEVEGLADYWHGEAEMIRAWRPYRKEERS